MQFGVWAAALGAFRVVLARMSFINPPTTIANPDDLSLNNVYYQQTVLTVQWDGATEGTASSITLWQVNLTALSGLKDTDPVPALGGQEYITRGVSWNTTYFPWTVTTRKDLTVSNMFVMALYKTGDGHPDDGTVYFNISSQTTSDSSPTLSVASTSMTDTSPSTASTSAAMSPPPSSSEGTSQGGLNTATTVGISVAIPVAVFAGIAAGWLIFRKRNNKSGQNSVSEPVREEYKRPATLPASIHEAEGRERSSTGPHEMYAPHLPQNDR